MSLSSNTNLQLSKITLGTWAIGGWMWGGTDINRSIKAIQRSIELGITSIDTAPVYGFGVSEDIVGKAIKPFKDQVQILTKYGLIWNKKTANHYFDSFTNDEEPISVYKHASKESIIYECEKSLKRLKVDAIDLYQIHWPDTTTPIDESMEAIAQLIKQGKVKAAGGSNYNKEQLQEAQHTVSIYSNQVPYSMVNKGIENELLPYCIENKVGILAYSPLQRGLLTGKYKVGHKFTEGDHRNTIPYYKEHNMRQVESLINAIRPIANDKGITISQLVLLWTLQQKGIESVLVGARDITQAEENAKAANLKISKDELNIIDQEIMKLNIQL